MSSSAGGTQTDQKEDDIKPATGKGTAASAAGKSPSSHAQTGSSSHHSGASVHSGSHPASHNSGGGSGTSHKSSSHGSHHSTPTAPNMPQTTGTEAPGTSTSTASSPQSTSTSTSTGMTVDKETQAPEIKVESGDKIITPTKYKDPSTQTDFTS